MLSRQTVKFFLDLSIWWLVTPMAFFLRLEGNWLDYGSEIWGLMLLALPLKLAAVYLFGLYRRSWHRVGIRDLYVIGLGIVSVALVMWFLGTFLPGERAIPRSVFAIEAMLAVMFLGGIRVAARMYSEHNRRQAISGPLRRILIVGAGEAGTMLAREMIRHPESVMTPVGYLDDDQTQMRQRLVGVRILGPISDLQKVVRAHNVDEVLIAMPSQPGTVIRSVVEKAHEAGVKHRIIPGIHELLSGSVSISNIRDVNVEDLLRRESVELETENVAAYLKDQVVLVTGAGGSIGSEIVRQVAGFGPKQLLLVGRGENSIYLIDRELSSTHPGIHREALIADVRDEVSMRAIFEKYRPSVVFHAAAHKHVPLMEANPEQAVFNNVFGTRNVVALALEYRVRRFVNISTDKAVNPTSVMGAAKRVAELIVHDAAQKCGHDCGFVSVRFGNVLGSRGSVIPMFQQQIERGGPVTVTHPDMRRYFMTIPEATQLVLQAGSMMLNGAVYVLDMGEEVKIVDLAKDLIMLCGKEVGTDIEIEFTGMRPGEKLFEELLMAEEGTIPSEHEKIFVARSIGDTGGLNGNLERLFDAASIRDPEGIREVLSEIIPSCMFDIAGRAVEHQG